MFIVSYLLVMCLLVIPTAQAETFAVYATKGVTSATCGDGIVDEGEECDDGNVANDDGCTSGCKINVAGDLMDANPDIDFRRLSVGQTIDLVAPDPTLGEISTIEDCDCEWSASPEARGSFSDETGCETELTLETTGSGQLFVTIDCGAEGFGNFFQMVRIRNDSVISGGGCSL